MPKPAISITTSDYLEEKYIQVDGKDWKIKLPGAGAEMRISQATRRMEFLDKKIKNGTAEEKDLDLYDKLEAGTLEIFEEMFNDGTEENQSVKDWVRNTPMPVILAAFDEIKRQAEENKKADQPGGQEETS